MPELADVQLDEDTTLDVQYQIHEQLGEVILTSWTPSMVLSDEERRQLEDEVFYRHQETYN